MSLDEDQLRIIDEGTDSFVKLVSLDSEIIEDQLSFSSWLLAISTAGLTPLMIRGISIIENSWLGAECARFLIISTSVIFIFSIITGGIVKYVGYEQLSLQRQNMSAWVAQRISMYSLSTIQGNLKDIFSDMQNMKYLSKDGAERYNIAIIKSETMLSLKHIMYLQQALTFLGLVILVLCAIPKNTII